MKVRSVKLREAHKASSNGRPSVCSVLWDHQALNFVTASSSDTTISIHDSLLLSSPPKLLRHHRDGVTTLALSPNSTCLASGSVDHSVKLYKFPGQCSFLCNVWFTGFWGSFDFDGFCRVCLYFQIDILVFIRSFLGFVWCLFFLKVIRSGCLELMMCSVYKLSFGFDLGFFFF